MANTMTGRRRVEAALGHEEPDRVPFDIGSGPTTGIHELALRRWMEHRGRRDSDQVRVIDRIQQLGMPPLDFWLELGQDVWPLWPDPPSGHRFEPFEEGGYDCWLDEWGVRWARPLDGGLYYDMKFHPLARAATVKELLDYNWPDGGDPARWRA